MSLPPYERDEVNLWTLASVVRCDPLDLRNEDLVGYALGAGVGIASAAPVLTIEARRPGRQMRSQISCVKISTPVASKNGSSHDSEYRIAAF